jgi:hypothetical protein
MKKLVLFMLIISAAFFFGACNTGGGGGGGGGDDSTDVIWTWGEGNTGAPLNLTEDTNNYPGRELTLKDCPNISNGTGGSDYVLGDISDYGEAILVVKLYSSDSDDSEITAGTGLAQFNLLLEGSSGWDDNVKLLDQATAYNLASGTPKSATPKSGVSGKPGKLLVQGSYEQPAGNGAVTRVVVQKLTLKLRSDLPSFSVVYGDSYVSTSGNKITFSNAEFKDGAALYKFPDTFPSVDSLAGKKLVFNFKLEGMADNLEHQIHIQAAGKLSGEDDINGFAGFGADDDPQSQKRHQCYVTLDGNDGYDQTFSGDTGVFKIPFNELIALSTVIGDNESKGYKGPFTLSAVRIVNNGTNWTNPDDKSVHNRNKSYSVIFTSITVE